MTKAENNQDNSGINSRDNWVPTQLEPGTKVYRLDVQEKYEKDEDGHKGGEFKYDEEGNPVYKGEYFVTEDQLKEGDYITTDPDGKEHFDAERFADDLQIGPYAKDGTYKDHVSVFETKEPIDAETGVANANYAYGRGGGKQVFISESEQGKMERVDEEYEVDNRTVVDKKTAADMLERGKEIASIERGDISEDKMKELNEDAAQNRKEAEGPVTDSGINAYGLTKDELDEMEEAEYNSRMLLDDSYQESLTSDQYDDVDDW